MARKRNRKNKKNLKPGDKVTEVQPTVEESKVDSEILTTENDDNDSTSNFDTKSVEEESHPIIPEVTVLEKTPQKVDNVLDSQSESLSIEQHYHSRNSSGSQEHKLERMFSVEKIHFFDNNLPDAITNDGGAITPVVEDDISIKSLSDDIPETDEGVEVISDYNNILESLPETPRDDPITNNSKSLTENNDYKSHMIRKPVSPTRPTTSLQKSPSPQQTSPSRSYHSLSPTSYPNPIRSPANSRVLSPARTRHLSIEKHLLQRSLHIANSKDTSIRGVEIVSTAKTLEKKFKMASLRKQIYKRPSLEVLRDRNILYLDSSSSDHIGGSETPHAAQLKSKGLLQERDDVLADDEGDEQQRPVAVEYTYGDDTPIYSSYTPTTTSCATAATATATATTSVGITSTSTATIMVGDDNDDDENTPTIEESMNSKEIRLLSPTKESSSSSSSKNSHQVTPAVTVTVTSSMTISTTPTPTTTNSPKKSTDQMTPTTANKEHTLSATLDRSSTSNTSSKPPLTPLALSQSEDDEKGLTPFGSNDNNKVTLLLNAMETTTNEDNNNNNEEYAYDDESWETEDEEQQQPQQSQQEEEEEGEAEGWDDYYKSGGIESFDDIQTDTTADNGNNNNNNNKDNITNSYQHEVEDDDDEENYFRDYEEDSDVITFDMKPFRVQESGKLAAINNATVSDIKKHHQQQQQQPYQQSLLSPNSTRKRTMTICKHKKSPFDESMELEGETDTRTNVAVALALVASLRKEGVIKTMEEAGKLKDLIFVQDEGMMKAVETFREQRDPIPLFSILRTILIC